MIDFSNREMEVMEVLWRENRSLTAMEIYELSNSSLLLANSIYLHINSLLKKGAIEVVGSIPTGRKNSRIFKATFSEADYISIQVTGQISARANPDNIKQIILTAIKAGSISEHTLDELQNLIEKQREGLKK